MELLKEIQDTTRTEIHIVSVEIDIPVKNEVAISSAVHFRRAIIVADEVVSDAPLDAQSDGPEWMEVGAVDTVKVLMMPTMDEKKAYLHTLRRNIRDGI